MVINCKKPCKRKRSTMLTVEQMVDIALGTPEIGAVNFNVLHALIHVIIQRLNIQKCLVEFKGYDSDRMEGIILTAKPGPILKLSEYMVDGADGKPCPKDKTAKDGEEGKEEGKEDAEGKEDTGRKEGKKPVCECGGKRKKTADDEKADKVSAKEQGDKGKESDAEDKKSQEKKAVRVDAGQEESEEVEEPQAKKVREAKKICTCKAGKEKDQDTVLADDSVKAAPSGYYESDGDAPCQTIVRVEPVGERCDSWRSRPALAHESMIKLEEKVAMLQDAFEALEQMPTNEELKKRAQGGGNVSTPVKDLWQLYNLNKRVESCEGTIEKLASMIEDLVKETCNFREAMFMVAGAVDDIQCGEQMQLNCGAVLQGKSQGFVKEKPSRPGGETPGIMFKECDGKPCEETQEMDEVSRVDKRRASKAPSLAPSEVLPAGSSTVTQGARQSMAPGASPGARQSMAPGLSSARQSMAPGLASGRQSMGPGVSPGRQSMAPGLSSARQSMAPGVSPAARQSMAPGLSSARQSMAPGVSPAARQSMAPGLSSARQSMAPGVSSSARQSISPTWMAAEGVAQGANPPTDSVTQNPEAVPSQPTSSARTSVAATEKERIRDRSPSQGGANLPVHTAAPESRPAESHPPKSPHHPPPHSDTGNPTVEIRAPLPIEAVGIGNEFFKMSVGEKFCVLKEYVDCLTHQVKQLSDSFPLKQVTAKLCAVASMQKQLDNLEKEWRDFLSHYEHGGVNGFIEEFANMKQNVEHLNNSVTKIKADKIENETQLKVVTQETSYLKRVKADLEMVEDLLAEKADTALVNKKVSHDQFDAACDDLTRGLDEALEKLMQQEVMWHEAMEELQNSLDNKLDKVEIMPLKEFINKKLTCLQEKLRQLAQLRKVAEAAGAKSRILRNLNCIACDGDVVMKMDNRSGYPSSPLPPSKSLRPMLTYELDQVRKAMKKGPTCRSASHAEEVIMDAHKKEAGIPLTNTDAIRSKMTKFAHYCNRYCGGSHTITTPQQRVTRIGHFLTEFGPQAIAMFNQDYLEPKSNQHPPEIATADQDLRKPC